MTGKELVNLGGGIACFPLAALMLAGHRWALGMGFIPFGLVLIVAAVAMYRDRKRNADRT